MVVVMKPGTRQQDIDALVSRLKELDLDVGITNGVGCTILGLVGDTTAVDVDKISINPHVERVMRVTEPYKKANRKYHPEDTVIELSNGRSVGGNRLAVIAGPCSVESAEQVTSIDYDKDLAEALKNSYAIYSKEYAMQTASDDYENNKTNTLYAYQAAKIDRDAQKESTTASFRKLYTDLQEKQTALAAADADLAQAKKTFTVSQVQYTRGMISKMAYTDALDTFTTAQETEVAARIDLLTAYNTYQWAKRGVITATT